MSHQSRPASHYDYDQLADIYNQARVDYIVPMPMNAKRMREYVESYDIDLDASVVTINDQGLETGVGMLGLRDDRAWITRLGVIPERRGRHLGQFLMEAMLESASDQGCRMAQLEVIVGNVPAHSLFLKLGFEDVRELLIIRRPPNKIEEIPDFEAAKVTEIPADNIPRYLSQREAYASWIEETASLLNAGSLHGLVVELPDGECGWLVYQKSAFSMTHFVLKPDISENMALMLLYHVHKLNAMQDTKLENIPSDHPTLTAYDQAGYFEVFRRTEMYLYF